MPSTTKSPGTLADSDLIGAIAWTNASNAQSSDNAYSVSALALNEIAS